MNSAIQNLRRAAREHSFVRLRRAAFDGRSGYRYGFVCGSSVNLVLLQKFTDRLDLDGFEVLRNRDVTECDLEFPRRDFYLRALTVKGLAPNCIDAPLGHLGELVQWATKQYEVLVVDREEAAPNECLVGAVVEVTDQGFRMRWMTPSAQWKPGAEFCSYSTVTRVEFGSEYETTLGLVAKAHLLA